ncbi:hypothetical protein JST97_12080, partial [bacterium]|nr:hypothetical protein [bacterium]
MSQPDRRSLLIGACRKRQDQIRHKLAQVRQRLEISQGLEIARWEQVEQDLLNRYDQEEQRIQRLLNESLEVRAVPELDSSHESAARPERVAAPPQADKVDRDHILQQFKRAQLLLAQKSEQLARLQAQLDSRPAQDPDLEAELLAKDRIIAELRRHNQNLEAQPGLEELSAQLQANEARLAEFVQANEELAAELEAKERLLVQLRQQPLEDERLEQSMLANQSLTAELAHKTQELAKFQNQVEQYKKAVMGYKQAAERANNRQVELSHQNESLRADLALNNEVVGRLQFDLELKTGDHERALRQIEELQQRVHLLESRPDQQSRLGEMEAEVLRLSQENSDLSGRLGQVADLQRQVDDLVKEVTQSQQDAQDHLQIALQLRQQMLAQSAAHQAELEQLREKLALAQTTASRADGEPQAQVSALTEGQPRAEEAVPVSAESQADGQPPAEITARADEQPQAEITASPDSQSQAEITSQAGGQPQAEVAP